MQVDNESIKIRQDIVSARKAGIDLQFDKTQGHIHSNCDLHDKTVNGKVYSEHVQHQSMLDIACKFQSTKEKCIKPPKGKTLFGNIRFVFADASLKYIKEKFLSN